MPVRRSNAVVFVALVTLALLSVGCTRGGGANAKPADLANWEFPQTVEVFRRSALDGGPSAGEVIAEYEAVIAEAPVFVSVFVYPAPELLHVASDQETRATADDVLSLQHFADNKLAVEQSHASARLLSEGTTSTVQRGAVHPGRLATYRLTEPFLGPVTELDSTLHQFRDGPWVVKVRATYPASIAAEAGPAVTRFIDALAWPALQ
ncbi:MAG: hypothetical protein R3C39_01235 [Dehalococcoidia bacterium]